MVLISFGLHDLVCADNAHFTEFGNHNTFLSTPEVIDVRTSLDGFSDSQGFADFSLPLSDQGFSDFDELNAPAPFTTSAPRILQNSNAPRIVNNPPQVATGGIDFSQAQRQPDGRLCVIKESSVETLAKDPILECTHKNVQKCHYTYVTQFTSAQEEVCEENFEKLCQITFKSQATRETVKKCYRPMKKVCNGQGKVECKTVYETSCSTRYLQKQPGQFVGQTECEKLPIEICGAGCVAEEGPEECHDKDVDTVIDVPEEVCDLNPQKTCRFVTKLVPRLKPKHECTTFPQEVCNLKFGSPRKERKPLKSEWCLDESPVQRDETYGTAESQSAPVYLPA